MQLPDPAAHADRREKGGIEDHFSKYVPRQLYRRYNSTKHIVTFYNGSKLFFGHIKSDRDLLQYQGAEFLFIGWEELTQFTFNQWDFLKGSNRCAIKRNVFGRPTFPRMVFANLLLQFWVLSFGLLQNGNIRISVFPQRQEILIRAAGLRRVALQSIRAAEAEMCQCSEPEIPHN